MTHQWRGFVGTATAALALGLAGCAGAPLGEDPGWPASTSAAPTISVSTSGPAGSPVPSEVDQPTPAESIPSDTATTLSQIRETKVFFGHQSVGYNVMKGVNLLAAQSGVDAPNYAEVKAGDRTPSDRSGYFAHAKVGENGYPLEKLDEFDAIIRGGLGDDLDIALIKLCYIDFDPRTDARAVFGAYRQVMGALEKDYPEVAFVYSTVPLEVDADKANTVRTEFNELVRKEYAVTGRLWDIAAAESTDPDGGRVGGERYEALYPAYASDGAHLNEVGAVAVAEPFTQLLASLAEA